MKMIIFICMGVLCLGMGVVYSIFNQSRGWKGMLTRGFAVVSCLVFGLICANLNQINNALPLFVTLGLSFVLLSEFMIISEIDSVKAKMIIFGVMSLLSNTMFALSVITLTRFNIFAILGGILLGLGMGCIVCAIKKYKRWYEVFAMLMSFASIGLLLVEGVFAFLNNTHTISSILILVAGAFMATYKFIGSIAEETSKAQYFASIFNVISLIAMATSIYFY